ncbi:MAG TPA: RsmD family RNA methyltransferase, partial [Lacipirellula sp.]
MTKPKRRHADEVTDATELKIIGGRFRGRKLKYEAFRVGDDPVTRPMKHRVRESIFNLVGMEAQGKHAIDLFAGTGALGLEALSRGASRATFIERHVPTARVIEENIKALGVEDEATLLVTSAFLWGKRDLGKVEGGESSVKSQKVERPSTLDPRPSTLPWLVFCSPPYAFFVERQQEMLGLIEQVMQLAPEQSIVVVEADERFDFSMLPPAVDDDALSNDWDVRTYPPAVVGVWR